MLNLLGDHQCKLDNKGRLLFPAKLRKQMEEVVHRGLIVNRNVHEPCLTIYTMPEWEKIQQDFALFQPTQSGTWHVYQKISEWR